jgi:DNA-binding CsgD family transcriptional regulator
LSAEAHVNGRQVVTAQVRPASALSGRDAVVAEVRLALPGAVATGASVVVWGAPAMGSTSVAEWAVHDGQLGTAVRLTIGPDGAAGVGTFPFTTSVTFPGPITDTGPLAEAVATLVGEVGARLLFVDNVDRVPAGLIAGVRARLEARGIRVGVLAVAHVVADSTASLPTARELGLVTWVRVEPLPGPVVLGLVDEAVGHTLGAAHRSVVTAVCAGRPGLAVEIGRHLRVTPAEAGHHETIRAACARAVAELAGPWLDRLPPEVADLALLSALLRPDADVSAAAALLGLGADGLASARAALQSLGLEPASVAAQEVIYRAMLTGAPRARVEKAAGLAVNLLERLSACPSRRLSLMTHSDVFDQRYAAAARLAVLEAQDQGALDVARQVVHEALVRCPSAQTTTWANQAFLEMSFADRWDSAAVSLVRSATDNRPVGSTSVEAIPIGFGLESPEGLGVAMAHTADSADAGSDRLARVARGLVAGRPVGGAALLGAAREARARGALDFEVCRLAATCARGGPAEHAVGKVLTRLRTGTGLLCVAPSTAIFVGFTLLGLADYEGSIQLTTIARMSGPRADLPELALAHLVGAHAFLRLGQLDRARGEALSAAGMFERVGASTLSSVARATAIHADIEAGIGGDREVGPDNARMHPLMRAYLVYVQGRVELARGRSEAAVPLLLEAGRVLGSAGLANPSLLNWRSHLASVFAASGQDRFADTVTTELGEALGRWARTNPVAARRRAAQLGVACLGGQSGAAPVDERISQAERRVVDLIVAGRSSSAVARQLYLSKRTVDTHLNRVYRRLGVHSRDELRVALAPSAVLASAAVFG